MAARRRLAAAQSAGVRILGIDPGTLRLGYGVIDHHGPGAPGLRRLRRHHARRRALARDARLLTIGRDLRELLPELEPDVVAMEQAFFGKNVQATLALGEARGVALFVAQEHGLALAGYPPARVKQIVTGRGAASKEQVGFLRAGAARLRRAPAADAADALAIAICHARLRRIGQALGARAAERAP